MASLGDGDSAKASKSSSSYNGPRRSSLRPDQDEEAAETMEEAEGEALPPSNSRRSSLQLPTSNSNVKPLDLSGRPWSNGSLDLNISAITDTISELVLRHRTEASSRAALEERLELMERRSEETRLLIANAAGLLVRQASSAKALLGEPPAQAEGEEQLESHAGGDKDAESQKGSVRADKVAGAEEETEGKMTARALEKNMTDIFQKMTSEPCNVVRSTMDKMCLDSFEQMIANKQVVMEKVFQDMSEELLENLKSSIETKMAALESVVARVGQDIVYARNQMELRSRSDNELHGLQLDSLRKELYGRIKVVEASFAARDDALLLRAREGAAEESKTACRAVLADEVVSLHAALRSVTGSVELRLSLCDGQVASAHERLQGLASDVAQGLAQSTEAMRSVTNYKKQAEISRAEATAHTLRKAQEMLETWMARLKDKGEEAVGSSRGAGEGGNWGGGRFDSQESLVAWMEEELSLRSMELSKGLADVDERVKAQALEPPKSVVALKNQIDSLEGYVRQRLSNLPATGASANSENLADLLPQVEGLLERTASRLSGEMKEHVADQLQALQTETAKALESSLADLKSDIADVATAMVELEVPGTPHVRRAQQPETELPEAENEVAGGSRGSSQEPATNRSRLLSLAAARNGQPAASLSGQSREELLAWVKVQVREMMAAETRQRLTRRFSPPGGGPEEPSVAVVELQARLSKVEEKCHELSFEDIDPSAIKSVHLAHLVSEMQRLGARQKTLEQIVNVETGEMMGLDTQRELSELRQLAEGSATDGKREVENVSRVVKGMQRELERAAASGDDVHVAVAKLQGRFDTTMQVILRIVEDLGGDVSALKQTMARDGSGSAAFVSFAAFQEALGAFEDSLQGELGRVREEFLDLLPFKANGGDVTELSIRLEEAFGQIQALAHRISNQAGGVGDDAALFRTPMTVAQSHCISCNRKVDPPRPESSNSAAWSTPRPDSRQGPDSRPGRSYKGHPRREPSLPPLSVTPC